MGNIGIKVSKSNMNIQKATDIQLAFTSKLNLFKQVLSGIGSITIPAGAGIQSASTTITHNLGYKPAFFIFSNEPQIVSNFQGTYRRPNNNAGFFQCLYGFTNNNILTIKARDNSPATDKTFTFKYFILIEDSG